MGGYKNVNSENWVQVFYRESVYTDKASVVLEMQLSS